MGSSLLWSRGWEVGAVGPGPAGLVWEHIWVRVSKIKGWHSGTDYFSPFPVVPAWPLHAPWVPQQTCWEAWSKAGIAIPTVLPLPGLLEGAWAIRELRAADLTQACVSPHPNPIGLCSFCFPLSLL